MKLIERLERSLYIKVMKKYSSCEKMAKYLGVSRKTVNNKIKKYKLRDKRMPLPDKPEGYYRMLKRYPFE